MTPQCRDDSIVHQLEHELKAARAELHSTIEALQTSNEDLKAANDYAERIVDTVRSPLLVLTSDLRVRSANRAFYEAFHIPSDRAASQPFEQVVEVSKDAERLRTVLAQLLAEGAAPQEIEIECIRPGVGTRTMRATASALSGPDGARKFVVLALEDITERIRTEQALRATNEALRGDALFDGAPTAIAIVDAHGRILSANAQMQKVFGYGREELIGQTVETLVPAEIRAAHVAHRTAFVARPETRHMGAAGRELVAVRKDGTRFPVEIGLGPVHTQDGLLTAVHITDISARKQAEAELRAIHEGLERRVLERTAELRASNERLSALSARILQLQDEERRRIAQELHDSTAQHLAGVAMNLARVQRAAKRLSAPAQEALTDSVALVDQCSEELRTLSYLLHPPLLDDVGLVPAVRWYAEGFAKRSGINVDVTVTPDLGRLPPPVEQALFRIVQECLGNVHRHAGSSVVHVQILGTADAVTLRVEDEGRGIPPEMLQALTEGTVPVGMGLMGMRERVEQLGGQFEIRSSDAGTVVEAIIPLAERPAPSGAVPRNP